jgi:hypothetical protein
LGIPEEKAKVYNERVKAGDYLLIVSGNEDEVNRAGSIMRDRHIEEFEIFEAPERTETEYTPEAERVEVREEVETVPTHERARVREEVETVPTHERARVREEKVVETHDLTGDNEAEVIIKDERRDIR